MMMKKAHLHQLKRKALMEDAVDLCTTRQIGGIHLVSRSLYALLKVHAKLLNHPTKVHIEHVFNLLLFWVHLNIWICKCTVDTDWSKALVLRAGSSGRKFLYSSTSFSSDNNWPCSLLRNPGNVSRMWLVSCWREIRLKAHTCSQVSGLGRCYWVKWRSGLTWACMCVNRMWAGVCQTWLRVFCRCGVPMRSAKCL